MGIFDKLTTAKGVTLSPRAALLLGCITMIAADGSIDDDELAIVNRIDGPRNTPDWDEAVKVWKRYTFKECCDFVVEFIDQNYINPLMANLVDIAMADGELAGDEKGLLNYYLENLNVDEGFVEKVVEVIQVKNSVPKS